MQLDLTDLLTLYTLTAGQIVTNLGVALACSVFIALLYRWTYRGTSYAATFTNSLVTLALITAVVMMVIGNNLARAFGLVGAMSIIRFRTAVKDTQDLVFIFLSLAVGLAAGVGLHRLAFVGTLFIGLTIVLLTFTRTAAAGRRPYLLQMQVTPTDTSIPAYQRVLDTWCRTHQVVNVKSFGNERLEVSFYIRLRQRDQAQALIQNLRRTPGVEQVNLFFDDESF
jgi:uncharacterized membrane protein YhiD involved in acid resistance